MCSLFHLCRSRGWELYHAGELERAIAEWRVAADLDPEDGYVLTGIGLALSGLGQQEAAFSEWWKAIQLEPEYDVPYIYLADALFGSGYTSKALTTIRTALRLCPASANLHIRLGHYLAKQADEKSDKAGWEAAGTAFRQALDVEPGNSCALRYLAQMQWYLRKGREAVQTLKDAIVANPEDAAAHIQLIRYQGYLKHCRDMYQTIGALNKLPDSEALDQYFVDLDNLWMQAKIVFFGGVGLAAFLGLIWLQRRRRE